MKKLKKIKLTELSNVDLNERELGILFGSSCNCSCACAYAGQPDDS